MMGKRYYPMKQSELLERLHIPHQLTSLCSKAVADLIESGAIEVENHQLFFQRKRRGR
jgi:hypothetical protein